MTPRINFRDLLHTHYKEAWDIQEQTLSKIISNRESVTSDLNCGTLFFVEHPHVFTLGKSGQINNLLINEAFLKKIDASYYQTNRGGDITYHGPGQLVGYPVFDLNRMQMGIKAYIHRIEEAIIHTLLTYGIVAARLEGATGVWIDPSTPRVRKICAIGVRVSKGVTMHGFALNVNTDLKYFSYINPCGFQDKGVTSMQNELGTGIDMEEVKARMKGSICGQFNLQPV
jgi:lipoyl(octanoyl) transferase